MNASPQKNHCYQLIRNVIKRDDLICSDAQSSTMYLVLALTTMCCNNIRYYSPSCNVTRYYKLPDTLSRVYVEWKEAPHLFEARNASIGCRWRFTENTFCIRTFGSVVDVSCVRRNANVCDSLLMTSALRRTSSLATHYVVSCI